MIPGAEFEVFGSLLRNEFVPHRSDIDIVVLTDGTLGPGKARDITKRYFELARQHDVGIHDAPLIHPPVFFFKKGSRVSEKFLKSARGKGVDSPPLYALVALIKKYGTKAGLLENIIAPVDTGAGGFYLIGTCVDNPFETMDALCSVIDEAYRITREQFEEYVDLEEEISEQMDEYPHDYTFSKSQWQGRDVYFFTMSRIEHFYMKKPPWETGALEDIEKAVRGGQEFTVHT